MEQFILYVEDLKFQRDNMIDIFEEGNYKGIVAPRTAEECAEMISSKNFKGALLDFNLDKWEVFSVPITIDGQHCHNGVQLAECLKEKNRDIHIGLFSSYTGGLEDSIKKSSVKECVQLVEPVAESPGKHLLDFIEQFYQMEITVKPLHKTTEPIPVEIQSFYAKKIASAMTMKEYYWTTGSYAWIAGANKDISYRYPQISAPYTNENPEEKYVLQIEKLDFTLNAIIDKQANIRISLDSELSSDPITRRQKDNLVYDYFITKSACRKYISGEINAATLKKTLNRLGDYAKFESQKILFKTEAKKSKSREDIYKKLAVFTTDNYPQILDIYKGRIDSVEDGTAVAKLESVSPEEYIRLERFDSDFLRNNHLGENSIFEYAIFRLPYGGTASHIEPI